MESTGTGEQRDLGDDPSSHRPDLKRRLLATGGGLTAVVLAVPLVWGPDAVPVDVPFLEGTAWLANADRGEVAQVNGHAGAVEGRLDGLSDATEVSVTQTDDTVLVQADDEIRSIDPTSLEWGEQTLEAEGELVLGDDPDDGTVAYLVSPDGTASRLDPLTLDVVAEVELGGTPGHGVVAEGRLVLPVRTGSGTAVEVIDADRSLGTVTVGDATDLVRVSRVGEDVAVLNTTAGTLHHLDPSGPTPRAADEIPVDLPDGELLVPTELPAGPLWLVAPRDGLLVAVDLDDGGVAEVAVAESRHDLLGPVVLDDVVFVADRDTGEVIRVDAVGMQDLPPPQDLSRYGIDDASRAELMEQGGRVFVNDPDTGQAVVFTAEGDGISVDLNSETAPDELPPLDLASDEAPAPEGPTEEEPSDGEGEGENDEAPPEDTPGDAAVTDDPPVVDLPAVDPPSDAIPDTVAPPEPVPPTDTAPPPPTEPPATEPPPTEPPPTEPPPTEPPPTAPPADPPGPTRLTAVEGDGQVDLSWDAAPGPDGSPITYTITSEPAAGGQGEWSTDQLSETVTGLDNGTFYTFRVTPVNGHGAGPTASARVQPAGQPILTGLDAQPDGDRSFTVTFSYNGNGRSHNSCQVTLDGTPVSTDCTGGQGSATVDVDHYGTTYAVGAEVTTDLGSASDSTSATSAAKSLTVDGSASRWDGSCYWDELGTARPTHEAPVEACLDGNGPDDYISSAADGSTQQVVCRRDDVQIRDNLYNTSSTWLRLEGGGWMNTLYFTDWGSAASDLPTCS